MKIAVVGSHPTFREATPWSDSSWEVWACSAHNLPPHYTLPRLTRFYEVHEPTLSPNEGRSREYIDEVNKLSCPVYAMERSTLPRALPYPKQEVIDRLGHFFLDTSSIAYIFAHAILTIEQNRKQGVADYIGVFGVGQKSASEYTYQRPGIQFHIQMAVELGINVLYPEESEIGRAIQYRF